DDEDADGPSRGPSPTPGSRGSYRGGPDETAVVRSGGYGEPTAAGRNSLADAPTMLQGRPPVDEYPDPYGAPPPRGGQYGSGGYDSGDQYGGGTDGGGQGYGSGDEGGAGYPAPAPPPPAHPARAPRRSARGGARAG